MGKKYNPNIKWSNTFKYPHAHAHTPHNCRIQHIRVHLFVKTKLVYFPLWSMVLHWFNAQFDKYPSNYLIKYNNWTYYRIILLIFLQYTINKRMIRKLSYINGTLNSSRATHNSRPGLAFARSFCAVICLPVGVQCIQNKPAHFHLKKNLTINI